MEPCEAYESLLAEVLFGTPSPEERARLDDHVAACDACAQTLRRMRETLAVMDERERPAPPEAFWASLQEGLDDRLEAPAGAGAPRPAEESRPAGEDRMRETEPAARDAATRDTAAGDGHPGPRWLPAALRGTLPSMAGRSARSWAAGGALVMLLLAAGVFLGRTVLAPRAVAPGRLPAAAASSGQAAPLARRTRLHLARSKALLLEVDALDPSAKDIQSLGLPEKQGTARSLAAEAEALDTALGGAPDQERLRSLLGELRTVLLRIAALGEQDAARDGLGRVQMQINDSQLLLRVNLEELRLASLFQPQGLAAELPATGGWPSRPVAPRTPAKAAHRHFATYFDSAPAGFPPAPATPLSLSTPLPAL